jgi:hypothetical protein
MSSLKDLASLIMIPSLVKDGRLDTVKPLGNSIIHPDATGNNDGTDGSTPAEGNFTFTRGSNLSATRVNASQLIEKGRENVLTYSNDFSNAAWNKSNASVTSGQSGYDGKNNAWLLKGNTSNVAHRVYNAVSNTNINTLSVYVKASGHNYIQILSGNTVNQYANFDLSDGSIGNSGSNFTPKIESVGNDWYRISAFNNSSLVYSYIQLVSSKTAVWNESWAMPNATDGVLIQDAQAELGLVATSVIETGASTAQAGILENTPRLDYSGGATCPSLLLEPSRTNLISQSEYFGGWTLISNGTGSDPVLDFGYISPGGLNNAYKITLDSGAGTATSDESIIYLNKSGVTAGSEHTASVYLKGAVGGEEVIVRDTAGGYKKWTLTTEWARYEYTQTATATSYATSFGLRQGLGGVGTINSNAVVYIYGFQSEIGSYPTSYIPTYGVSQTRAGEGKVLTGASNIIGQTEGSVYFEFTRDGFAAYTQRILTLSNGTNSNIIGFQLAASNSITFYVINNDSLQAIITKPNATIANQKVKVAAGYAENDFVLYIDGVQVGAATSGTIPSTSVVQNNRPTGGTPFIGNIYSTLLFPTRLTNAELAALTTI